MASTSENNSDEGNPWVPEGYVVIIGPNDNRYVVPEFCAADFKQKIDEDQKKKEMEVFKAAGSVSPSYHSLYLIRGISRTNQGIG